VDARHALGAVMSLQEPKDGSNELLYVLLGGFLAACLVGLASFLIYLCFIP
jgi:hypothetical protein